MNTMLVIISCLHFKAIHSGGKRKISGLDGLGLSYLKKMSDLGDHQELPYTSTVNYSNMSDNTMEQLEPLDLRVAKKRTDIKDGQKSASTDDINCISTNSKIGCGPLGSHPLCYPYSTPPKIRPIPYDQLVELHPTTNIQLSGKSSETGNNPQGFEMREPAGANLMIRPDSIGNLLLPYGAGNANPIHPCPPTSSQDITASDAMWNLEKFLPHRFPFLQDGPEQLVNDTSKRLETTNISMICDLIIKFIEEKCQVGYSRNAAREIAENIKEMVNGERSITNEEGNASQDDYSIFTALPKSFYLVLPEYPSFIASYGSRLSAIGDEEMKLIKILTYVSGREDLVSFCAKGGCRMLSTGLRYVCRIVFLNFLKGAVPVDGVTVGIYEDVLRTENLKAANQRLGSIRYIDCFTRIFFFLNIQELEILFYGLAPGGKVGKSAIFEKSQSSSEFSNSINSKKRREVIRYGYWRLLLVMRGIKDLKNNELSSIVELRAIVEERGRGFHKNDVVHIRDSFYRMILSMIGIKYLGYYVVLINTTRAN
jgi:hypothetical protein